MTHGTTAGPRRMKDAIINYAQEFLSRHPSTGFFAGVGGLVSGFMTFVQQLSPIVGLIGAVFGCAAAFYTFRIKKREYEAGLKGAKQ